jgi:transposase-like protein
MSKHRTFTPEFKAQVVLEAISGSRSAAEICRQYALKPQLLSTWKAELINHAEQVFQRDEQHSAAQARIAELERLVGRLTLELEITKKASTLLTAASHRNGRSS